MMKTLNMIIFLLTMLITFSAGTAFAQNKFYLDPKAAIEPGMSGTLEFMLDNTMEFYGFQAEITLPNGIDIIDNFEGKPDITLTSRADEGYQIITNQIGSTLHIGVFSSSTDQNPFTGVSGALLNINVRASEVFRGGEAQIKNIKFIKAGDKDEPLSSSNPYINILPNYITIIIDGDPENTSLIFDVVGQTGSLSVKPYPENAIIESLTWESKDISVATIEEKEDKEIVTAVSNGTTTIEVTTDKGKKADCTVVVGIRVDEITLDKKEIDLYVGKQYKLTATIDPPFAVNKEVGWESNPERIATVDQEGNVTAHEIGDATITATARGGNKKTAICIVHVIPTPAEEIIVTPSSAELMVGQSIELTAQVLPEDTTDPTVTWTSSDTSIATVDQTSGKVTAHALGETIITATCGNAEGTCKITVIPTPATSITLDKEKVELKVGETTVITATVLPDDTTDKTVTWTSSDEKIATVDANGKVTAISLGEVTITAKCGDAKAICIVTVVPIPVESISLDKETAELKIGESVLLTATVLPENATDKTVTWTSSNEGVAIVDGNGNVTAIAEGDAIITASCGALSATCKVIVLPLPPMTISLSENAIEMEVNDTFTLTAIVGPDEYKDKVVEWASTQENIATVDQNGVVIALAVGTTTITAGCEGVYASCLVTVVPTPAQSIELNPTEATLTISETLLISAKVLPSNTSNPTIVWTSADASIASVDNDGLVTAIANGDVIITARCGDVTADCKITVVSPAPQSIELLPKNGEIKVGETLQATATVLPETVADKTVIWTSNDPGIATVDESGIITGVALGETIITASCGEASATCSIKVIPTPVEKITLTNSELLMRVGKTSELLPIVLPTDATDPSVTWSSEDESIATVDANGIVTAFAIGKTTIVATSVSTPSVKGYCYVTVEAADEIIAVKQLIISDKSLSMIEGDTHQLTATIKPDDASDKTLTWRSSDTTKATVDANGLVTAISEGEAIIYVSSSNGLTEECAVKVIARTVDPTGISLSRNELLMREGYTSDLIAIVRPDNASDKTVIWSTSDPNIATVNDNGIVTAIKQGNCVITASTVNGHKATCDVTVVPVVIAVEEITLNKYDLEMEINETFTLIATIKPDDATDKTVTWKSQDKSIAVVSEFGVVTAIAAGTTTIYASTSNGLTVECKVTVRPGEIPVESITISQSELLMREGFTSELFAIIRPDEATDKTVFWSTSDPAIATVDDKGVVSALRQGNTVITAASANGKTAVCYVTVVPFAIPVENITLNKTAIEIDVEETYQLIATITPDDATDKTVTWRSLDRAIATVSENGLVTGVSTGITTVYASSSNGITVECQVTVRPQEIEPTSISLTNTELLMTEGDTAELIAIVRPDNATDKSVTWTSSDEAIATVDQNGIVTAIHLGFTTVTASTINGKIATCAVTVVPDVVAVESITLNPTELEMEVEDKFTLIATITPDDASDKTVTWRSSDRSIATVDENGEVTAVAAGTATIYASSSNGLTAECAVTVNPAYEEVISISLTNTELLMIEGDSTDLIAIIRPDNATDKTVTWTSSDESIVTVDDNGNVDAIKQGFAVVSATASNGVKADCYVTVLPRIIAVESITISDSEIDMTVGDEYTLTATITPEDVTDKTITWKSSNRAIATVSDTGVVTAIAEGTASIYASSSNGLTAECIVHVHPGYIEVESISLTNTELLMREGYTAELYAIIRPDNATDKSVVWTSTDEAIATVDQNGLVTAIKQGNTVVSATANNGVRANCYVTVVPVIIAVEEINISRTELTLTEGDDYQLTATVMPEDATDKSVSWKSSDREVATVSTEGLVSALKVGTATIYASSSNGLTKECLLTVIPRIIEVEDITLDPTSLTISEGETASLTATVIPDDANDKTITWASSNPEIAIVEDGIVTGKLEGNCTITATSSNGLSSTCFVTVYARPLTPKQLLRKGDGSTCTFVVMMDIPDAELDNLGYRFVYGYNDANGESHVITETSLRYCHTSSEIYNDPSNDFWAFSLVKNKDGVLLNSNLRHLDGSEEVCFDTAKYGYATKGGMSAIATVDSDEWIKFTPSALQITDNGNENTFVAIYNMTGIQVFAKSYKSFSNENYTIDFKNFTPDTYIIVARRGSKVVSKKIVIR